MGRDTPLAACMEKTDGHEDVTGGRRAARDVRPRPDAKKVIDVALASRDFAPGRHPRRGGGHHEGPLTEYLPIQRKPDAGGNIENARS